MRRRTLCICVFIALVVINIFTFSCTATDENEYFKNITLSKDVVNMMPQGATDVFSAETSIIYCTFDLTEKIKDNSDISITWIYVHEENGVSTEYLMEHWTEKAADHTRMSMFIYQPVKGWPLGNWRADLYVDDLRAASIPFKVKLDL